MSIPTCYGAFVINCRFIIIIIIIIIVSPGYTDAISPAAIIAHCHSESEGMSDKMLADYILNWKETRCDLRTVCGDDYYRQS